MGAGITSSSCANKPRPSWVTAPLSKPSYNLTWSLAVCLGHRGSTPLSLLHSAGGFLDELFPQAQKVRKPPCLLLPLGSQEGIQVSESLNRDSLCILEETDVFLWKRASPPSPSPKPLSLLLGWEPLPSAGCFLGEDEVSIRAE